MDIKKIIVAAGAVLCFLILIFYLLSRLRPSSQTAPSSSLTVSPFPTLITNQKQIAPKAVDPTIASYLKLPKITPTALENLAVFDSTAPEKPPPNLSDLKNDKIYKTENLEIFYSSELKKYVFTRKTYLAQKEIDEWARENDLLDQIDNPDIFINSTDLPPSSVSPSQTYTPGSASAAAQTSKDLKLIADLFALLFTMPGVGNTADFSYQSGSASAITASPAFTYAQITPSVVLDNLIYYKQQDGPYDNYPLPQGCTIKKKGCGPTTAAMVLSSYVSLNFNPPRTVDYYQSQGYKLGCEGSNLADLQLTLQNHGLETTRAKNLHYGVANQVVDVFKNYLKDGYTAVALAEFDVNSPNCGRCGHYFWVVDVDANDNIWALDGFYGRRQNPQPFNENSNYPFPKYVAAFGVKPSR